MVLLVLVQIHFLNLDDYSLLWIASHYVILAKSPPFPSLKLKDVQGL